MRLYTTFEPCFMFAATIIGTYGIPQVAFASYDPTWDGLQGASTPSSPAGSLSASTWTPPSAH